MRMEDSVAWRIRVRIQKAMAAAVPRKRRAILDDFWDKIRPIEAHDNRIMWDLRDVTRRTWKGKP